MPLTANERLFLIRGKIERAKKNLTDLEAQIIANRDKYANVVIGSGYGPPTKLPRLPWNVIAAAGDVVHNLRSALDHLAYQLAVVGSPGTEPSRRIEFPIAKDAAAYEAAKARKVEGIRPEAIKVIDSLEPYKGGSHGDTLWRIHELDNIDKHRTLLTVGHDYILFADWVPSRDYVVRVAGSPDFLGVESFDPDVQEKMQFEIEEALSNTQVVEGDALLPTLHQFIVFVDDLIGNFVPFLE